MGTPELENESYAILNALQGSFGGRLVISASSAQFENANALFGKMNVRVVRADNFDELAGQIDGNLKISYVVPATTTGSRLVQAVMDSPEHKKQVNTVSIVETKFGTKPVVAAALAGALTQDYKLVSVNLARNSSILSVLQKKYDGQILVLQQVWEFLQAIWTSASRVAVSA